MSTIYFCSHNQEKYKTESWRHVFSQWYDAGVPFIGNNGIYDLTEIIELDDYNNFIQNKPFNMREEWMMVWKALIFANGINRENNLKVANQIIGNKNPNAIKSLGKKVTGYDETTWNLWKYKVVVNGNYLQFSQNKTMKKILLETGERSICEASPYDAIWGIGYGESNAEANRTKWGENLLGKAIMEVRDKITK